MPPVVLLQDVKARATESVSDQSRHPEPQLDCQLLQSQPRATRQPIIQLLVPQRIFAVGEYSRNLQSVMR
jgi:hypothetical protein